MTKYRLLAAAALVLLGATEAPAPVNEASYEILENGAGKFRIDIQGCSVASANVESITMEDLLIDEREMTTGADWDYRVYGPGDAHYGSITIRSRVAPGVTSCLEGWATTCSGGTEVRKDVTITILKRDGSEARTFNFHECFPTQYTAPPDPDAPDAVEEIVVQPTGYTCDADLPDEPVLDRGSVLTNFAVLLSSDDGSVPANVDPMWEFAQGGAEVKEKKSLPFADPTDDTQARLKRARSVAEVTLKGPMTPSRKALCQWITETVQGQEWKRNVAVTEIKQKGREKTYNYLDCFPTRIVFPALSASGTGNLYEEITFKPIRLEVK